MYTMPITIEGKTFEVQYHIDGDDELTCYMPDGSM